MVISAIDSPDDWSTLLAGDVTGSGELVQRYGVLVAAGPRLVLGQLGQSLDGFIASRTGDARFVTGAADREHLHRLRALVDAVVVGVNTVVADNPLLTVRDVPGRCPVRVVLDPSGRAPLSAQVFTDDSSPTLWLVGEGAPQHPPAQFHDVTMVKLPLDALGGAGFSPHTVIAALADRGLGRVLVEGGGVTVSRFLADSAIDRLWVTTAPVLVGDGIPGLRFDGRDRLADALRAPARRFVLGDDIAVELDISSAK